MPSDEFEAELYELGRAAEARHGETLEQLAQRLFDKGYAELGIEQLRDLVVERRRLQRERRHLNSGLRPPFSSPGGVA